MTYCTFEAGEELYITKLDANHAVAGDEPATVLSVMHSKENGEWVCCWVEYPDRPVRYQRNGKVLPREQIFLHHTC